MFYRKKIPAFILFLSIIFSLTGCDKSDESATNSVNQPNSVVTVAEVNQAPLVMTVDLPGRTVPSRIAEIRPQVSGIILSRDFTEGSEVQEGQPLYHIDAASLRAAVANAQAHISQASAQQRLSSAKLSRYRPLVTSQLVSRQEYDEVASAAAQSRSEVDAAKAELAAAQIDLSHATIKSPISGRIGLSTVTEGALIQKEQASAMATVQQLDPIYIDITQPGESYLQLKKAISRGELRQVNGKTAVSLILQDNSLYPLEGTIAFSDPTVDETTGAVTLRAVIPNPHGELLPGMFVRARLTEGSDDHAILIPQQAVTRSPRGEATTLVVDKDNIVHQKIISIATGRGTFWQVTSGLTSGDRIIIEGVQRVKPGDYVTPKLQTHHSETDSKR
ncbi:efflux RND transporter periplasmic adaptor subunit [Rahnella sp. PCH160]|uniref:efflux RND transporter periplasmic adaptor subunit n=1 Tax=Rahnella sp. PCH160 TaxID=3447928 RepID=UPI0039FDCF2C